MQEPFSLSDLGDVATVVLAALAIVVSVWTSIAIHRGAGPVVKVSVIYYVLLQRKKPERFKPTYMHVTTSLSRAAQVHRDFETEFFVTPFLRAIVTNRGRMDVGVDAINMQDPAERERGMKLKTDPSYPVLLKAQSYIYLNTLYSEVLSFTGEGRKMRFIAALTNGEFSVSSWMRVLPVKR